jgi:hypothetical protein
MRQIYTLDYYNIKILINISIFLGKSRKIWIFFNQFMFLNIIILISNVDDFIFQVSLIFLGISF